MFGDCGTPVPGRVKQAIRLVYLFAYVTVVLLANLVLLAMCRELDLYCHQCVTSPVSVQAVEWVDNIC